MRQEILGILEHNSKITIDDLATILENPKEQIVNEISGMEKEKIICGYHTLINWEKTSNEKVTALIEVKVTPQRGEGFDKIAERIYRFKEVKSVFFIFF